MWQYLPKGKSMRGVTQELYDSSFQAAPRTLNAMRKRLFCSASGTLRLCKKGAVLL